MDPELSEPTCKGVGNDRQAIQLTIVEPLKQFVHLQRFPIELQAKIWKFAIPLTILARIVSIIPKVKGNQLPSALFHLCFVARSEYCKHYERIVSKDLSFAFFFNYELDTLDINQYNSSARPFRRFNPPMPILTSIIDFSFPNLKLDMVRRLIVMVESRRIPTYPLPPWETNLSNKFQMLDGESFWLTIAKTFPSLKDLNFILNKVKVANLRQISFVEPTGPPYHRPVLPTLRVALQELIDSVIDGFVRRVSEFEEGASDSYWFDMTFDCLMFVEEKPSWYKGRPIPDYTSWL